jgi:cytochrome c biogenesis factor
MPLVAFILLAVLCLLLLGFVCACLTDHPAQAVERALAVGGALPALVLVWSLTAALALPLLRMFSVPAMGRSSPPLTQRFRF